jgi:FkbM family methyltransferase
LRYTSANTVTYTVNSQSASFYRTEHLPEELPERPVVSDLVKNLHPDDVVFDLGANHGIYTCLAGKTLESGQVVSFEPNPQTFTELRENVSLNQLADTITLYQAAVADKSGQATFFIDSESTGSSLAQPKQSSSTQAIQVDVVALDSLVDDDSQPHPDVVKIDVEGAEFQALRGMSTILQDECRLLYCEVHGSAITNSSLNPRDIEHFLSEAGFNVQTIFERDEDHRILKATR